MPNVKFGGYDFAERFTVANIQRPLPEFRVDMTEVDGMDGAEFSYATVGTRTCGFDVIATGRTLVELQDAARELMGVLATRETKRLYFSDERDPDGNRLYRNAVPQGTFDYDAFIRAGRWHLSFIQPKPYLVGKDRSVVIKRGETKRVQVGGNAETWWTATTTPPRGDTMYIIGRRNGDDGDWLVGYSAPFDGDHKLTVDCRKQTAKLSPELGTADGILLQSRFERMSGTELIEATHTTTLTWKERWL